MWHVVAVLLSERPGKAPSWYRGPCRDSGPYDSQEDAISLAGQCNRGEGYRWRYFVVHESELPLFGLEV